MDAKKRYEDWLENPYFDENTKNELRRIADDEKEIEERFYKELEFGTGRSARNHWCRHKPDEYLHGKKGNTGACKFYPQREC